MIRTDTRERINDYASKNGLAVGQRLGFGVHGSVFDAEIQRVAVSAIKGETSDKHFGRRWPMVEGIVQYLEKFGVFLIDINPKNITFVE